MSMKYRELERMVRGFSNHRRIHILDHVDRHPELSVADISAQLKIHFKTAAAHMQRLAIAGLVMKRNDGSAVRHKLTARGAHVLKFLRTLV